MGSEKVAATSRVQGSLHLADRESVADLRTDTDHARFEEAQEVLARVSGNLMIRISHKADENLF